MASTPQWKCYRNGEYEAACKHPEDAAVLMSAWPTGEVRFDHKIVVWREGKEDFPAGESYDSAAKIMIKRREKAWAEARARTAGRVAVRLGDAINR